MLHGGKLIWHHSEIIRKQYSDINDHPLITKAFKSWKLLLSGHAHNGTDDWKTLKKKKSDFNFKQITKLLKNYPTKH